jgi:hypothetical protein
MKHLQSRKGKYILDIDHTDDFVHIEVIDIENDEVVISASYEADELYA